MARRANDSYASSKGITVWIFAVLIGSFPYFLSYYDFGINLFDEGVLMNGIRLASEGRMDYARFCHYSAMYGYFAHLMASTGDNLLVVRFVWVILRALTAVLIFVVSTRVVPRRWALLPVFLFMISPGPWHKSFVPFLICLCLYLTIRARESNSLLDYLVLAVGIAFSIAIHIYTGLLTLIPAFAISLLYTPRAKSEAAGIPPIRHPLIYHGAFIVTLIVATFALADFVREMHPIDFLSQTASVLRSDFAGSRSMVERHLGVPLNPRGLFVISHYLVVFAVLTMAAWYFRRVIRYQITVKTKIAFQVIYWIGLFNLMKWFARFDIAHLLQNTPPVWVKLAFLAYNTFRIGVEGETPVKRRRARIAAIVLIGWLGAALIYGFTTKDYYHGGIGYRLFEENVPLENPRAPVYVLPHEAKLLQALEDAVDRYTNRDDYIVVCASVPMLYFLVDRRSPIILPLFDRPESLVANSEEEIIEAIRAHDTRLIVYRDEQTDGVDANRVSQYAPEIYRMIMTDYELVEQVQDFQIRLRDVSNDDPE